MLTVAQALNFVSWQAFLRFDRWGVGVEMSRFFADGGILSSILSGKLEVRKDWPGSVWHDIYM